MSNNIFYKDANEKYIQTVVLYAKENEAYPENSGHFKLYADPECTITPNPDIVLEAYTSGCLKIMEHNGVNGFKAEMLTPCKISDGDGYVCLDYFGCNGSTSFTHEYAFSIDGDFRQYLKKYGL